MTILEALAELVDKVFQPVNALFRTGGSPARLDDRPDPLVSSFEPTPLKPLDIPTAQLAAQGPLKLITLAPSEWRGSEEQLDRSREITR